jgi:hypothetical protein
MARLASLVRRKCFSSKLFPRSQRSSYKRSETPNCCSVLPDSSKMNPKHPPPGPAMTLGNMRQLGVQRLLASCLNPSCRYESLIEAFSYPPETEITYFSKRVVCAKCGARGRHIDVRPNWKEQPPSEGLTGKEWR